MYFNTSKFGDTVDCKTTEAGAKWMARAPNLGGATTNVK